jgi:hypothetical protein
MAELWLHIAQREIWCFSVHQSRESGPVRNLKVRIVPHLYWSSWYTDYKIKIDVHFYLQFHEKQILAKKMYIQRLLGSVVGSSPIFWVYEKIGAALKLPLSVSNWYTSLNTGHFWQKCNQYWHAWNENCKQKTICG